MIKNKKIKSIIKEYEKIWAIEHAQKLMSWDAETYMPEKSSEERSTAEGIFAKLAQKSLLKKSFQKKIKNAEKEKTNETEKGIIRILKRNTEILEKLPPSFVEKFAKTTSNARIHWKKARETNKFKEFQKHLQEIIRLNIKKAEYLGFKKPYDALLDLHEEGLTSKETDKIFSEIKTPLKNILKKIKQSKNYQKTHPLENEKYEQEKLSKINNEILKKFGFDLKRGRMDISTHPFTQELSSNDVRITTRYEKKDFKRSITSTIHEFGHALYELQISPELRKSPAAGGVSMGIHESQSRFWENIIGKNKEFIKINSELFKKNLPFIKKYNTEEIYKYFNNITPSLIRVESDEITYNFHIMLRYEIEKDLIEGKIQTKELPEIWNSKMQEYLGINPSNDREGVLQDIHWSMGSIGYFPTYSIGTILSCQICDKMEKNIGKINDLIKNEEYQKIKDWLKENIHQYGSIYTPKQLIKKSLGEEINPDNFIKHIKEKINELY
jgi:carboxypeptidase Taq